MPNSPKPNAKMSAISEPKTDLTPEPSYDRLKLDAQLCFPIYAANNLITRAYRSLLEPLGLTYPQYLVMLVLWETPQIAMAELARRLLLDSGTLTPLLKRMQAAGLLERRRASSDERRLIIELTSAGADLKAQARTIPEAMACRLAAEQEWLAGLRMDIKQLVTLLSEPGNSAKQNDYADQEKQAKPGENPAT
ncbi:MarR family transcriptional regulator [Halioxenophilus sp. WMMB6]|uniref:MarR family winged helix-turn-helix transcriptional regulator n=1 Tax=Halioxenophilus sp. WMMB6 TaxID=3073815 RepID=UPI00295F58D4|nr:MarR family transcriptional regulator [Halioxenophilus sp. WMMB6]